LEANTVIKAIDAAKGFVSTVVSMLPVLVPGIRVE